MSKISKVFKDPDTIEREFTESGLECCTRIVPQGHRCGYVAIPKGHPLFGMDWENEETEALDVDGGITFGEGDEDIWVLGWDAGHGWHLPDPTLQTEGGDLLRMFSEIFFANIISDEVASKASGEKYMVDADMAEAETRKLARQLAEMQKPEEETSNNAILREEVRDFAKTVGALYYELMAQGINYKDVGPIICAIISGANSQ